MDTAVQTDAPNDVATESRRVRWRWLLMGGGTALLLIVGIWYYATSGRYMSTDDASVRAAQTGISTNIAGRVVEIAVHENQTVHRGDILFRLDSRPYEIQLQDAAAKLAAARLQISAAKANYRHQAADRDAARETLAFQQRDMLRQQRLVQAGITSRAQFEQAQHATELAQQQLNAADQQLVSALATLGGSINVSPDLHPMVMQAQAALDRAKLELSYTTVTAPDDGVVTKVEQLQLGSYVTAATEVFTLVSTRDVWVEADFKEDQLAHMHAGQSATVKIDSYPGETFHATLSSLSPGTGSQFSVLPAENATGNWVKVVQRVPVRLTLTDADRARIGALQSGLSATVSVDTHYQHAFWGHSEARDHGA